MLAAGSRGLRDEDQDLRGAGEQPPGPPGRARRGGAEDETGEDGAEGVRFLDWIGRALEDPYCALLEG